MARISAFEIVLLVVGIAAAILGFLFINQVFSEEGKITWLMIIAVFNWLTLLVLFISLSLAVDISKKQLEEIKNLAESIQGRKGRK